MTALVLRQWLPVSAPPGYLAAQAAVARGPLLFSGALSEGQFYSPPESFAGEGWWVGNCFSEGLYEKWVGWVYSVPSFSSLGKVSTPLPFYPPAVLYPATSPQSVPTPSCCHLYLFSAGSDNESDEDVGKKSFSAQVFGCLPPPDLWSGHPGEGASAGLSQGGQGPPRRGWTSGGPNASQRAPECLSHRQSGPLGRLILGPKGGSHDHSTWGPHRA